jgi:hypothetical protein
MNTEAIIQKLKRRELRLVVCDGYVMSVNDRDRHYIGPMTLLSLYRIPHDVPYVVYPSHKEEFCGWRDLPIDVRLAPLRNGEYSLEKAYDRSVGAHADT